MLNMLFHLVISGHLPVNVTVRKVGHGDIWKIFVIVLFNRLEKKIYDLNFGSFWSD